MIHDCHYIVLDLETGGYVINDPKKKKPITQVGLCVLNHKMEKVFEYSAYIKPYVELHVYEKSALDYTGTTIEKLMANGKDVGEVYADLKAIFTKYKVGRKLPVLVGHNIIEFDLDFLFVFFERFKDNFMNYIESYIEDTMWISRKMWGHIDVVSHKLPDACERMGITLIS